MREEDNIEKEGLQEDNPDIGDNSGDEDFAEYDDLSALEGLPQIDELDNMDDLSGVSDVASTIDFDESGHQDESEDDIDIPLPEYVFSFSSCISSICVSPSLSDKNAKVFEPALNLFRIVRPATSS